MAIACSGAVAFAVDQPANETPSPQLAPEDVVRTQLNTLSADGPIPERIKNCYRFASPANREHTGPVERFGRMLKSPSYDVMLRAHWFLVGKSIQQGNEAHLLVTIVDNQGQLALFRFFLSKQVDPPYADCWMTDSVLRLTPPPATPPPTPPIAPEPQAI
jgi:Domain of unknown function (DUF4864)